MIVTREWIEAYIMSQSPEKVMVMVGRALMALNARQTEDEKAIGATRYANGQGFNAMDAAVGTSMAEQFAKTRRLTAKQVAVWTKPGARGCRLAKYARQLNEAATERKAAVVTA